MRMRNILLIQSRERPDMMRKEQENFLRVVGESARLEFLSALDDTLDWAVPDALLARYDGIIFGGSSYFDLDGGRAANDPSRLAALSILSRVRPLILHALEKNLPVLGICFGHQLIAEANGGRVMNDRTQGKAGSYEVHLTGEGEQDVLFSSLPKSFVAQYGHKDSVTNLPSGATLLARGSDCRFSALRYNDGAYSVQFHPEVTHADFAVRLKECGYLPENVEPESVVRASPEASGLISQWIGHFVAH